MIKIKLKQLLADKAFQGEKISLIELAEKTGISRSTLNRIANTPGYSTTTDNLDKLCEYLNCSLQDLAEYIPENG
jgi:putative transcriptional regulator